MLLCAPLQLTYLTNVLQGTRRPARSTASTDPGDRGMSMLEAVSRVPEGVALGDGCVCGGDLAYISEHVKLRLQAI